jgi:CHRD domain
VKRPRKRRASALALVLATSAAIAVGCGASPTESSLGARLDAHHVITPKNRPWTLPSGVANARGTFTATLSGSGGRELSWRLRYSGLGSSSLEIADVHYGPAKKFGPILFRLCGPCKSGQHGAKRLTKFQVGEIKAGMAWVTVITGKYPNGVIRGQIQYSR